MFRCKIISFNRTYYYYNNDKYKLKYKRQVKFKTISISNAEIRAYEVC